MDRLTPSAEWHDLLSRAARPFDRSIRPLPPVSEVAPTRGFPSGEHYREIAGALRDLARHCRFPGARRELLHLASNYVRRGDHIDSRSR